MIVHVAIKGSLELNIDEIDGDVVKLIKSALTFINEDRLQAEREQVPGWWDLPETIEIYREEHRRSGHVLIAPRGFADQLAEGIGEIGGAIEWADHRVSPAAAPGYFRPLLLRDYQHEAVIDLLSSEQGFYECPPGGGKTVAALGMSALINCRTLVIVDKADLLEQWRERAAQEWLDKQKTVRGLDLSLDFDHPRAVGKIGQDVWEERDLTIALRQSLWSRIDELDATKWWRGWGTEIFDEGHHLSSDTLSELSLRCEARFMYGMSATPARTPTKGLIVAVYIGPIRHRTSKERLRKAGVLVMPKVEIIRTDFQTDFWPTHNRKEGEECKIPNCRKSGKKHMHRNNYSSCVKKLVEDDERNKLIAHQIVSDRGHYHLVYSRQLKHLDLLKKAIEEAGWDGPIFMLRGEENAKKISRAIVAEISESHECVIFSTVAEEGLDIPILDRLHLPFPIKQQGLVQQVVGRVERATDGKDTPKIFDYADYGTECFAAQAPDRETVYRMDGYPIKTTKAKAVPA